MPSARRARLRGDDVVEQRPQRFDGEVERAGDEHGAVPERPVLAHPADGGRERLREDEVAEHLDGVRFELVDGGALVAAVEVAEEVAAVAAVGGEQRGRLAQGLEHEAHAVLRGQPAGGEPRVRRHHVRRDERVLEVEGGEVAGGVEHLAAEPVLALLAGAPARGGAHPGVLDDRRQVDSGA